jgi:hypothetical protein
MTYSDKEATKNVTNKISLKGSDDGTLMWFQSHTELVFTIGPMWRPALSKGPSTIGTSFFLALT